MLCVLVDLKRIFDTVSFHNLGKVLISNVYWGHEHIWFKTAFYHQSDDFMYKGTLISCSGPAGPQHSILPLLGQRLVALIQVFVLFIIIWKHFSSSHNPLILRAASCHTLFFTDYSHEDMKLTLDQLNHGACVQPVMLPSCLSACFAHCGRAP